MDDDRLSKLEEVFTFRKWERRGFIESVRKRVTGDMRGKTLKVMEFPAGIFQKELVNGQILLKS